MLSKNDINEKLINESGFTNLLQKINPAKLPEDLRVINSIQKLKDRYIAGMKYDDPALTDRWKSALNNANDALNQNLKSVASHVAIPALGAGGIGAAGIYATSNKDEPDNDVIQSEIPDQSDKNVDNIGNSALNWMQDHPLLTAGIGATALAGGAGALALRKKLKEKAAPRKTINKIEIIHKLNSK